MNRQFDKYGKPTIETDLMGRSTMSQWNCRPRVAETRPNGSMTKSLIQWSEELTFVYDGYLCVKKNESTTTPNSARHMHHYYTWDPTEPVATRPLVWQREGSETAFYFHDGNKNVSDVVSASGEVLAHYTYAPFGDCTATGSLAESNPWRFSSEYADDELGCVYYNYRPYEPITGRWMQRDLKKSVDVVEDESIFLFCYNRSVSGFIDWLGLEGVSLVYIVDDREDPALNAARRYYSYHDQTTHPL